MDFDQKAYSISTTIADLQRSNPMLERLRDILDSTESREGRAFDLFIQALILVSLVSFSIETLPELHPVLTGSLERLEVVIVGIFSLEYVVRLLVSKHRAKFVFSFYGMVDLFAILPFYVASGVDLRALRAFRLFRLLRVLKLLRYGSAVERFGRAFSIAKEEFFLFLFAAILVVFLASVGIYYCERDAQPQVFASVFHSLWWAVATLTTVGYGDMYPITPGGKLFTFVVLMIGMAVVAVPAGLISSALSRVRELEEREANAVGELWR